MDVCDITVPGVASPCFTKALYPPESRPQLINAAPPLIEFFSARTMVFHAPGCLYGRQKNRRWKMSESVKGLRGDGMR